jgi:Holliday junction resolvase-like predicted endonuclease
MTAPDAGRAAFRLGLSAESRAAAAEAWLAIHPNDVPGDIRFDVMLVAPRGAPRHLTAAFDASAS